MRELATQFLTLAEKQGTTAALMIGHRLMGNTLLMTGDIVEARAHHDQALAFYDPAEHRLLATRFGQDVGVAILCYRPWALWLLGYSEAALADAEQALEEAREIGHAATLMYALWHVSLNQSGVEITRQRTRLSMNLSLWQTKEARCFGRPKE
jgi:hypothetical protein